MNNSTPVFAPAVQVVWRGDNLYITCGHGYDCCHTRVSTRQAVEAWSTAHHSPLHECELFPKVNNQQLIAERNADGRHPIG